VDAIGAVVAERGIEIVEDCAQAHGAELRGRHAGTIGRLGCFIFYPTKNLGALGDGGAIVTDDAELAGRLQLLRRYGETERYVHVSSGVNSRLDEIQAAVLRTKLPHLEDWNRRRAEVAAIYADALTESSVRPLEVLGERHHVFHLFVVEARDRTAFQEHLAHNGVQTLIHYPKPVHGQPPYRSLGNGRVSLTNAERLCRRVVSVPLFPELTDDEVERVAGALRRFSE
jgi:dTDP-4-amino-4,6-dideoxygalactose transaminase